LFALTVAARTVPDPAVAADFFTAIADKLLRSTFDFGITNIPVQTNGVFCFTPAVHRLLQVAANVRDAANTNFYPTVFRPVFFNDAQGNIFITGWQQVASVSGAGDPQLAAPIDLVALPAGISTNNVYGVPWIIGTKKFLPGFNEFYSFNTMQVMRRLQFLRMNAPSTWPGTSPGSYRTNQMLVMSITNHMGFSFWNSYATNYPGGALTVFARDFVRMRLSYGNYSYLGSTQFIFATTLNSWPGANWDRSVPPAQRSANPSSFITGNFDFPFVHEAAIDLDQSGNVVGSGFTSESFNSNVTTLPPFPNFELDTTNYFQGFILDGSNIVDYVQFSGLTQNRNLGDDLKDVNYLGGQPTLMWSTNNSGIAGSGVNWGVQNQIYVSQTAQNVPAGGYWSLPQNLPGGMSPTVAAIAAMFRGFFTPTWIYANKVYINTNLVQLAPYIPTRTVVSPVLWVANDPLVHYLTSDLLQPLDSTIYRSDNFSIPPIAIPNLSALALRFQPWGRNAVMETFVNVLHDDPNNASYNLAYRDPLVWTPDDWNFPATNSLPLTTLGQIHRGTPWQTLFLKSTNILSYTDFSQANPAVGINTWQYWTGDFDANDAAIMAPVNDWRLAALVAEIFCTNAATQLTSVNAANWPQLLGSISVQTNSTITPDYSTTPQFDSFVMASNSPQAFLIANGIASAKANRTFASAGDVLSAPEISVSSPWLNTSDPGQIQYGISDAAYEMIPAQLLPQLRPDSTGGIFFTNGVWCAQFSGADAFDYILQSSPDLVNWSIVVTNQPVRGKLTTPLPLANPPQIFYRTILLP
jgi:hypothetical protein